MATKYQYRDKKDLTKEQYDAYKSAEGFDVGGTPTEQIKKDVEEFKRKDEQKVAEYNIHQNNLKKLAEKKAVQSQIEKMRTEGYSLEEINQKIQNPEPQPAIQGETPTEIDPNSNVYQDETGTHLKKPNILGIEPRPEFKQGESIVDYTKNVGKDIVRFEGAVIGKLYDFSQSLFSGGKGIEQKEAEQTFGELKTDLLNDLEMVKTGLADPNAVSIKLGLAIQANQRLRESISGLNKINLRYFVLHGSDVQTQLIQNEAFFNEYYRQLELAKAIQAEQQAKLLL